MRTCSPAPRKARPTRSEHRRQLRGRGPVGGISGTSREGTQLLQVSDGGHRDWGQVLLFARPCPALLQHPRKVSLFQEGRKTLLLPECKTSVSPKITSLKSPLTVNSSQSCSCYMFSPNYCENKSSSWEGPSHQTASSASLGGTWRPPAEWPRGSTGPWPVWLRGQSIGALTEGLWV